MLKRAFILFAAVALTVVFFAGCGAITVNNVRINEDNITPFDAVSVTTTFSKIEFVESDRYGLDIYVPESLDPEWGVTDGRLTIIEDTNGLAFNWGVNLDKGYVKVYYPSGTVFTDITLNSSGGEIELPRANVADLNITSSSGGINASAEGNNYAAIESSSGDITFSDNGGKVNIKSSSGKVRAETNNCGAVDVTTSSGGVTLTGKGDAATRLSVNTQSGRIDASGVSWRDVTTRSTSGRTTISGELLGETSVETSSGAVQISVDGSLSQYGYNLRPGSGSIYLNGERMTKPALSSGAPGNNISVVTSSGGIRIDFSGK